MIASLPVWDWLRLGGALALFLGPGVALLVWVPSLARLEAVSAAAVAVALSISFWPPLLAALHLVDARLSPPLVGLLLAAAWGAAVWGYRRHPRGLSRPDGQLLALMGVLALSLLAGLWSIRATVAGLGSDSYHHTLITQMIVEAGGLPNDYGQYAPLVTFSYHFGSHAVMAVFAWLTGISPVLIVPIVGQGLKIAAVLAVAALTAMLTGNRGAALVSAVICGLVCVFPSFYVNWGRYPQLTGLVLLPVLLGLLWLWLSDEADWRASLVLGLLAAGVILAHYRVALMTVWGALVLAATHLLVRRPTAPGLWRLGAWLAGSAAVALLLIAPWVWHVIGERALGYPIVLSTPLVSAYSLERLGPRVLSYPTNWLLAVLVAGAAVIGLWKRQALALAMLAWSALMWLVSGPGWLGEWMDTVSVVISLYVPAAVVVGLAAVVVVDYVGPGRRLARGAALGVLGLAALIGGVASANIADRDGWFVTPDDLTAIQWIQAHTPAEARFMVNVASFGYSPDMVLGSDAGYWLPVLAGRRTVLPPMVYTIERAAQPGYGAQLAALRQLDGHLATAQGRGALRAAAVDYVYVGERGGSIAVDELLASPHFRLEYQSASTYVFKVLDAP